MSDYLDPYAEKMHATLRYPEPSVHLTHPFRNKQNHEKLLSYVKQRLKEGAKARDALLPRLVSIDKNVAGWIRRTDEDRDRAQKQERDGIPQAIDINLPLSYVHLDDMMTYFAATFAPNRGMFYHTGKPEEVGQATQIVSLMNNHAIYGGYYREVLLGIFSNLKYNRGGFHVAWAKEEGPNLVRGLDGKDKLESKLRWQGNKLEAIDVYNFLCDPCVHPSRLHCDGEYGAIARIKSRYWLAKKASEGVYFNCAAALGEDTLQGSRVKYYRHPPSEASLEQFAASSQTDWAAFMTGGSETSASGDGFELVECFIKINPTDFGLIDGNATLRSERNKYETWRITLLNDEYIIDVTHMNNIHGHIPYYIGLLNDDLMGVSQKSTAEILKPLQDFASFLLNTHVRATRKNIWGLLVYDPSVVDLSEIPAGETSARVPIKPEAQGRRVDEAIWEHSTRLDTAQTMGDLESVMGLINQFFPTQSLPSQIASIDRAVDSQVAAVQQGANRRQQKAARLLDDTVFRNVRFAMYYNIIQYQPDNTEITDFYTGKPVSIDLQSLRDTDLPFIIGQGLKAIDRQAAASMMQQIIFALIQAPAAAQGIDMLRLIDHWTSMIDVDIDMTQFRVQAPVADATPVAGVETAAGISPATNPQAITEAIYGKGAE